MKQKYHRTLLSSLALCLLLVACGDRRLNQTSVRIIGSVTRAQLAIIDQGGLGGTGGAANAVQNVLVSVSEIPSISGLSDTNGNYTLEGVPIGFPFTIVADEINFDTPITACNIEVQDSISLNIVSSIPDEDNYCRTADTSQAGILVLNIQVD